MILGSLLCSVTFSLVSGMGFASALGNDFEARIRPEPLSSDVRDHTTGLGTASASLDGKRLVVRGSYLGMQGPATLAQLHLGPVMGVRGPAFADIAIGRAAAGEFSATLQLNSSQIKALRTGRVYIEIHSEAAPEGNLWGWLLEVR